MRPTRRPGEHEADHGEQGDGRQRVLVGQAQRLLRHRGDAHGPPSRKEEQHGRAAMATKTGAPSKKARTPR